RLDLHSFPTRRSSDLPVSKHCAVWQQNRSINHHVQHRVRNLGWHGAHSVNDMFSDFLCWVCRYRLKTCARTNVLNKSTTVCQFRSEEHTSELQSRGHL